MVGLTGKLVKILELRKKEFTGMDIKLLVEAIAMAEGMEVTEKKKDDLPSEGILKEWMFGGDK